MSDDLPRDSLDVDRPGPDDTRLVSVTTIIRSASPADGLIYWSAEETAKAAVRAASSLQARIAEEGEQAVVEWLTGARFRRPKGQRSASELGTAVHQAVEQFALTGERPSVDAEVAPYLDQFDRWAQQFQPEYVAAEMTVFSPTYGYAGTADAVMVVGGARVIADYKTSRKSVDRQGRPTKPYPEVGLQLAAYRHADFAAAWRPRRYEQWSRRYYLLGEGERSAAVDIPEVDGGIAIHLTPDHCHAHTVRCDEAIFDCFLYVLEAARFHLEVARTVVGEPLVP